MTSEQQYYEAKVFLNAYKDALNTLDQIAANKAALQRSKTLEAYLVSAANKGEIHIEGGNISEGSHFSASRIRKLGLFSKILFSGKFATFESANSIDEATKILQSYL